MTAPMIIPAPGGSYPYTPDTYPRPVETRMAEAQRNTPGQIWERVAEATPNDGRPWSSLHRGHPVKHSLGYARSGIIRAGERIK